MAFMAIAMGVIGVGIMVLIGYLMVAQVQAIMPTGAEGSAIANISDQMNNSQATIFAGFSMLALGALVMAAFGLITIFK